MKKISIEKNILETFITQHKTKKELCQYLGISIGVINRNLILYNLEWPAHVYIHKSGFKNYPLVDKAWLILNWVQSGKTLPELALIYDIPLSTLEHRAVYYKLHKPYKYLVDITILFNKLDPNIAYIAGLLNTDGYFPKKVDSFEISLCGESERLLLENVVNYIKTNAPIVRYGTSYRVRVCLPGIRDFFSSAFGIDVIDKTYSTSVPKSFSSEACALAYVRGCFDGDGYISKQGSRLTFTTASENFVLGLKNIIQQYTGVSMCFYYEKRRSGLYPTISALKGNTKIILDWIYKEPGLKLERKYLNYCQVKDIV